MSDPTGAALRPATATGPLGVGTSHSAEQKPRSWDKFSHWVACVCVVTFDLELGQAIEVKRSVWYALSV